MDVWPCLANRELLTGDIHVTLHRKANISGSCVCFSFQIKNLQPYSLLEPL